MQTPTPTLRQQLETWAMSLLVVLCVFGQVAVLAHHLLERHAACVQHGGEHVVHLAPDGGASARRSSSEDRAAPTTQASDVEDDHQCTVLSQSVRVASGTFSTLTSLVEAPPIHAIVARLSTSTWQIIALLRLAPKTSPPLPFIA